MDMVTERGVTSEVSPPEVQPPSAAWRPTALAQWSAIGVVVAWCALLAFGLPWLATATTPQDQVVESGSRVAAGGVEVSPPEGWVRDADVTGSIKLTKGGVNVLIFPASESTDSPVDIVEARMEIFRGDTSTAYEIGEPRQFSTDYGLSAASAAVLTPERASVLYAFSDGARLAEAQANASHAAWDELGAEIDQMMATVGFAEGAS